VVVIVVVSAVASVVVSMMVLWCCGNGNGSPRGRWSYCAQQVRPLLSMLLLIRHNNPRTITSDVSLRLLLVFNGVKYD
jgi:hypothetical protein